MRSELPLRVALVAVLAAGAVASLVTYVSVVRLDRAANGFVATGDVRGSLRAFRAAESPLNPSMTRDTGIAILLLHTGRPQEAERLMGRRTRAEPQNALAWVQLTKLRLARRELAAAHRSWARARELNPHLPRRLPRAA